MEMLALYPTSTEDLLAIHDCHNVQLDTRACPSLMRMRRMSREDTYEKNRAILLSTVEDPEPHGGAEQLGAPAMLECGLVWMESRHRPVPS